MHAELTLLGSAALLVVGAAALLWFEWTNAAPSVAGRVGEKLLAASFDGAMPRSGGLSKRRLRQP